MTGLMTQEKEICIIIGHSGCGKSTLCNMLSEKLGCESLGFSYAGRTLAGEDDPESFDRIQDYIFSCVEAALERSPLLILDGFASDKLVDRIRQNGWKCTIFFLDVPDEMRWERIARREGVSREKGEEIDRSKEAGKQKSGLGAVIAQADHRLDGRKTTETLAEEVGSILKNRDKQVAAGDGSDHIC